VIGTECVQKCDSLNESGNLWVVTSYLMAQLIHACVT